MRKPQIFNWSLNNIFWPPGLIFKQFSSVLFYKNLTRWNKFNTWLFKHSFKSLPMAAGSIGMGCIGFPAHPIWEVTSACNLECIHCHTGGGKPAKDELTTDEAKKLIDELIKINEFRILVYSGGEPLLRPDIFELLHYSRKAGFINIIATNGTLVDEKVASRLREAGVVGAAVSLDSSERSVHNHIRGNSSAFQLAMRGIDFLKKAGIFLQINVTVMEYNFENIGNLVELTDKLGAGIMLIYQLIPIGRGYLIEDKAPKVNENKKLLEFLAEKQRNVSVVIEPVDDPQYWPYLMEKGNKIKGVWMKLARKVFHGCTAGRGLVYIKSNGDIWPCPFIEISAGNIRDKDFGSIWRNSEVLINLRDRENTLKGKCGKCNYIEICGGCRGRAMAYSGDYLAEDPLCFMD